MSNFPSNDLRRRKLQTGLTITTLTLSVASTLFLLLFTSRIGFNAASNSGVLTLGLSGIFSNFTLFIGTLIIAVGVVLTSFIAFLMMAQRTRDFGLIKAAGCPNNLVLGYFTDELLVTSLAGCGLGVVFGFLMDYTTANVVFSEYRLPNFWFGPAVFVGFFVLTLVFGLLPILKASKMSPVKALSPIEYNGLTTAGKRKPISKGRLTWRIAERSLSRRQSASLRMLLLLSIVFILLTVSVAGGIIARDTTASWVQNSINPNSVAIATMSMGSQYEQLLSKFTGGSASADFNYSDPNFAIPQSVVSQLDAASNVVLVDSRLVLEEHVTEISNFTVDYATQNTYAMGGNRQGEALVMGVNPSSLDGSWNVEGNFLNSNDTLQAVIGDSIAQSMYSVDQSLNINQSNPLVEGIEFNHQTFNIVGVCVDPTNNGLVTYVPIETLMNQTAISNPNLLMVQLKNTSPTTITQIKTLVHSIDPNLTVFPLNGIIQKDANFMSSAWQTMLLLPIFSLASAAFCLVGYMMLTVEEQHQEFAVLRAIGAKPKTIIFTLAIQSLLLLLSSFGIGILIGTILTVVILVQQPMITGFTMLEITLWLLAALMAMFVLSLYPALKLTRAPILKIMT